MKRSHLIASLLLTFASFSSTAATDRSYYVTELVSQQKFDVYNDGRNTYVQSIPGLIVTGATADRDVFIVAGVPSSIRGFLNGKPITIVRGIPPLPKPVPAEPKPFNATSPSTAAGSDPGNPTRPMPGRTSAQDSAAAELGLPGSPTKPAVSAPAVTARPTDRTKRDWTLYTRYQTLEEALNDFAMQVDYEVVYEAREFPLDLKRDIALARDVDFWEALRLLGEAYRKSDGAFQILPTKYKQIVVLPAGQQDPMPGEKP